ncbi:MAG: hypothetical protein QHI38_05260 [Armatimonadota bacterium]|nr:hypothetical protein [Armatimonadota bacterium]
MAKSDERTPQSVKMQKKRIILDDGRYLIYYSFGEKRGEDEGGTSESNACSGAEDRS